MTTSWLLTSLFWLGILFIPVGLALIIVPKSVLAWGESMNRWISTREFFNILDRPRNHERFFYRHHRIFGMIIMALSIVSLYMLAFYAGLDKTTESLDRLAKTEFESWLFISIYYILLVLCSVTLVTGIVIFIRPSLLKSVEGWANRWVDTEAPLEKLNDVHEIPLEIIPGKPRLFGFFVLIGAVYIVYITGVRIF